MLLRRYIHWRTAIVPLVLGLLAAACGGGGDGAASGPKEGPTVTIGSFNFAESQVLAHLYGAALEEQGYSVEVRLNIGAREVVQPAMEGGDLDFVPEYTGNALRFQREGEEIELREEQEVYDELQAEYEQDGLVALAFSNAQDVDGLAVTRETAEEHGLEKISDLKDFEGTFKFGAGPECVERLSCLEGYRQIYGLTEDEFEFVSLDVAGPITVEALKSGEVDGANLFTTQGVVAANGFVMLEDDMQMQLPQNIVPVTTNEIVDAYGQEFVDFVDSITELFTEEELTALVARVEVDQEDPEDVARDWLVDNGFLEE
ncbi:MAG: ABC transporter substrate-binding protein [Nitriliruptorales bacterium]